MEGDAVLDRNNYVFFVFLSTPSGWRATPLSPFSPLRSAISIHALRVEGDCLCLVQLPENPGFLSTPSGWRATLLFEDVVAEVAFLSTPSGWRATLGAGGIDELTILDFYPRPPGGGRQQKRTKFSSVFAQKGEEFASLRRGKRKICRWHFKKDKFWALIWCEGSGKSVCALVSHCG